jgi:hypothetical protein
VKAVSTAENISNTLSFVSQPTRKSGNNVKIEKSRKNSTQIRDSSE